MNKRSQFGFTLVELMFGMTAVSILVLTVGVMLFYSYLSWTRMQAAADMQRDATLAMDTMASAIRGGWTNTDLWVSSTLKISNTNKPIYRFTLTGDRLVYTVNGGASMNLVQRGLSDFICTETADHRVQIVLNLNNTLMNMSMTNTIYGRK